MLSALDCARLCQALYQQPDYPWDDLLRPEADDGICLGVRLIGGIRYFVFRGSVDAQDWLRDGCSELFHVMPGFEALGDVALGFSAGMPELFRSKLERLMEAPWVAVGHSLGAARAQLMTGMAVVARTPPLYVFGFGAPRVGMGKFAAEAMTVGGTLYRNRRDPVARVPTSPPFLVAWPEVPLAAAPATGDTLDPFADHHIDLYVKALGG